MLLFLDEPTSGLDSNTAWSICQLLRKLANQGHAILCTIHQPSAKQFEVFDKLLFLVSGKSAYFGDIGRDFHHLVNYFENFGAKACAENENPAEWLLSITDAEVLHHSDWAEVWSKSKERHNVQKQLAEMSQTLVKPSADTEHLASHEFASPFINQLLIVIVRTFLRDWRTPSYLYSKIFLTFGAVSEIPTHLVEQNMD